MFEWCKETKEPIYPRKEESGDLRIKRVDSHTSSDEMSVIFQFFSSVDVIFHEDFLISFPVTTDHALHIVQSEIVPHFSEIKHIFINNRLTEIQVRLMKEKSKRMLSEILSTNIHPFVSDLYRNSEYNISTYPRTLKYYAVEKEKFNKESVPGTEALSEFLKSSFFLRDGMVTLMPSGWFFEESLGESVLLQSFSTFANKIVMMVNEEDNRVIALHIYK